MRHNIDIAQLREQVTAAVERNQATSGKQARRPQPGNPPTDAAGQSLDIDRLTDKVVSAIDRRAIAYRERMGRQ